MTLVKPTFVTILFLLLFPQQSAPESPELKEATVLTTSVEKLAKEGKFNEALPLAKRALEIRDRLLPPNDPLIATSVSYLADLYTAKRDFGAARTALQRLLQMQQERGGPKDAYLARTVERLALVYLSEGNLGKAEEEYKRALQLREKQSGVDSLQVAQTLEGLATVYRARNDFDRGARLYKRALNIYGRLATAKSAAFDQAAHGFVCLAHETGHRDEAKELDEIWKQFAPAGSPPESPYSQLNAKALNLPMPRYPVEARARRVSGTVVLKIRIDEKGAVIDARDMCQGPPLLVAASLESARNARFSPATISGKAVQVNGVLTYRYVAQ
jgi:TonB family protein